jgi:hypothetical protein
MCYILLSTKAILSSACCQISAVFPISSDSQYGEYFDSVASVNDYGDIIVFNSLSQGISYIYFECDLPPCSSFGWSTNDSTELVPDSN